MDVNTINFMKFFSAIESSHRFTYGAVDDTYTAVKVLRYFKAVFLLLGNKFCSFRAARVD